MARKIEIVETEIPINDRLSRPSSSAHNNRVRKFVDSMNKKGLRVVSAKTTRSLIPERFWYSPRACWTTTIILKKRRKK